MTYTQSLFTDYFGQLAGRPCWEATAEFGTWLSLSFGKPHVRIHEGNPDSQSEHQRRRQAYIQGDFLLWFEMGEWEYFEDDKRKFHARQSRAQLRRAAARLQSQCLCGVQLVALPAEMVFDFDLGGRLRVRPSPKAEPDDPLWHLYAYERCLTFLASGTLVHGASSSRKLGRIKARLCPYIPFPPSLT